MKKSAYFASQWYDEAWPGPEDLERYFAAARDGRPPDVGSAAVLWAKGVGETAHLNEERGRVDRALHMWVVPDLGVMFVCSEHRAGTMRAHVSAGDSGRAGEMVRTRDGDELPANLFVSLEKARRVLREFTETDGELPRSIDWIADKDLPPNTFLPSMTLEDEEARDAEWDVLYEKLCLTLAMFGTEDATEGDFWVVDESNGLTQHKVYFNELHMLEPEIVKAVQALLPEFSDWEIFIAIYVDGKGKDWPEMGLIIRRHEIVDGLQRQYFPPEYQGIQYEGSRVGTDRD